MAFLFSVLIDEGFSIMAASHGQQALDLLERGLRPHVILIDLLLPRVSGVDVLTHIRADRELRTIPRIVMTGSSQRAGIVADAVFAKPFDHDELVRAIRRLIEPEQLTGRRWQPSRERGRSQSIAERRVEAPPAVAALRSHRIRSILQARSLHDVSAGRHHQGDLRVFVYTQPREPY